METRKETTVEERRDLMKLSCEEYGKLMSDAAWSQVDAARAKMMAIGLPERHIGIYVYMFIRDQFNKVSDDAYRDIRYNAEEIKARVIGGFEGWVEEKGEWLWQD